MKRIRRTLIISLIIIYCSTFCFAQPPIQEQSYFLTLKNAIIYQEWNTVRENLSVTGKSLQIAGVTYQYGIGTHANSEIIINLDRQYETFNAIIGVDDDIAQSQNKERASIIFKITLDGKVIYASTLKRFGTPPETVTVAVNGGKTMKLVVNDAGDGNDSDHADWAMAKLVPSTNPPPRSLDNSFTIILLPIGVLLILLLVFHKKIYLFYREFFDFIKKKPEDFFDRFGNMFFFGIILILGILVRVAMFPAGNVDLDIYGFGTWYGYILTHGHFAALKDVFSNYNVPYLYLLTLGTYFPVAKYTAIKLIAVMFDLLGGVAAYKIIGLKYQSKTVRMLAFLVVFLSPTVMIQSGLWGQCDIIYTTFILGSLYFAFKKKGIWSQIFFGLAFSFKLQALFFLPLIGIFVVKKLIKVRHLLWIPIVFLLLLVPALIAGRSMHSLLSIYINQYIGANAERALTCNCANFYQLFANSNYDELANAGKLIALIACVVIIFYAYKRRNFLDEIAILKLGVFNNLIVIYLLPNMHERYFFPADILSIILAFYLPRLYYLPILIGFSSLFSYLPFIRGGALIDMRLLAVNFAVAIILLAKDIIKDAWIIEKKVK